MENIENCSFWFICVFCSTLHLMALHCFESVTIYNDVMLSFTRTATIPKVFAA